MKTHSIPNFQGAKVVGLNYKTGGLPRFYKVLTIWSFSYKPGKWILGFGDFVIW
jgi:hypothetical protein